MYVSTNGEYLRRDSISTCSCAIILSSTSSCVGVSDSFAHTVGGTAKNANTNGKIPRAYMMRPALSLGASRKPTSARVDKSILSDRIDAHACPLAHYLGVLLRNPSHE